MVALSHVIQGILYSGHSNSPSQSSNSSHGPVPSIACEEAHCWPRCGSVSVTRDVFPGWGAESVLWTSLGYFSARNPWQGAGLGSWLILHTASVWQRGTEGQVRTVPRPCQVGKGQCHILLGSRDEWAVRTSLHLWTMSRGWAANKQLFLLPQRSWSDL